MNKKNYDKLISNIRANYSNITCRTFDFLAGQVCVLYTKELTDRNALSQQVIKPLVECGKTAMIKAKHLMENIIFVDDCKLDYGFEKLESVLLSGMTVILFSNDSNFVVANLKKVQKRAVATPEITYTLRGPKDCFIENLDTNISLLRYRFKSKSLKIDYMQAGARTKSSVAIAYFDDIANDGVVKEVKKRIEAIDIDGIYESGELQSFLLNKKTNLFPQMGITERSDMACGALLEGKVVILIDGCGIALIAPKVLSEFLWSCDDIYDNKYIGFFLRILRIFALVLSFSFSAVYIATVSFHNDILPSNYVILLAQARAKVPFNAVTEVLIIELIVELLREALIRVPSKIGTAIGIVGAIIIGEAAISAGIFSPLLLIVLSLSLIASFVPSDFTLLNAFRILKYVIIIMTGILGFYGMILGMMLILAQLVSINTFGVAYMAPYAPFIRKDALRSIFYSKSLAPNRPSFLKPKDKYRGKVDSK